MFSVGKSALCHNNWASDIYEILPECGMEDAYIDRTTLGIKLIEGLMVERTNKT